jgi:addiction module RelE/StbE family toxin
MQIDYHKHFKKQYKKLSSKLRNKCDERVALFKKDPFAVELNNHALQGEYDGYRSINITGDLRAVYEIVGDCSYFIFIDTHSNLY